MLGDGGVVRNESETGRGDCTIEAPIAGQSSFTDVRGLHDAGAPKSYKRVYSTRGVASRRRARMQTLEV